MRGAVFAYHSQNVDGQTYSTSDHVALEQDLRTVGKLGIPILSLWQIASKIKQGKGEELPERFVGFSCDDGTVLDWEDYVHPVSGWHKSFANIVRDFADSFSLDKRQLLTSFVIASPEARNAIDKGCYEGLPLSDDDWWPDAAAEGLLAIENHSWDHLHPVLPDSLIKYGSAGDFYTVDDYAKAGKQVRDASEYINTRLSRIGKSVSLFAYPYGHASSYLSETYFPRHQEEHGIVGAFTTVQGYIDPDSNPYALPRFMCGDAWNTPQGFEQILASM